MSMITVSPAGPADVEAMAALLEEMDRFCGPPGVEPVDPRVAQITDALFTKPVAAYALLAWDGAQLVGFAAYSFLWPAVGLARSLYLKDLYVAEECQRRGVGTRLMRALFEVAVQHGCSRVEWTTDTSNQGGQEFYQGLGVPPLPSKIFYRVEDDGEGLKLPS
jgi:ribosomal protein S18 acetylase RimI-like enzyme